MRRERDRVRTPPGSLADHRPQHNVSHKSNSVEKVRGRRFERGMFLALLGVALIPTALVVSAGTWALRDTLRRSGSAGPWEAVAASGDTLAEEVARAWGPDSLPPSVARALAEHREALDTSAEMSRLWTAVSTRVLERLPFFVTLLAGLVLFLAWAGARVLARGFARPVGELVEWTGRIARQEPLPEPHESAARVGRIEELAVLGRSLRTLSNEVADARERAVEAARLSAWSAAARRVAHEIKNPLTPMKMAARQLRGAATTEAAETSADVLLEEIDRLDRLARTFSQVGSPPEGPPAPVDLGELTESLVSAHDQEEIRVSAQVVGSPPLVHGHLGALRAAIRNLIVNAVEACEHGREPTGPAPRVWVRVEEGRAPEGAGAHGVSIVVEDEGVGIPRDLEARVWNLDVTTKRRGSGIGLPLVRQTVLAHGGQVTAANRPGGGARFAIWIPAMDESVEAAKE